jgi:hypothetical protein
MRGKRILNCRCWPNIVWHALNIVKYHNVFYRHTIVRQGLPKHILKQHLQFEVHCWKLCFLDDANIWDFSLKVGFETSCVFLVLQLNKLWHLKIFVVIQVFTYSWNLNFWSTMRLTSSFWWIWCVWIPVLSSNPTLKFVDIKI